MKLAALILIAGCVATAQTPAEDLIEAGHWKRARAMVEARLQEAPRDPLATYLISQVNFAFGRTDAPVQLAERAVALGPGVAKFHRQLAEALGVKALRSNLFQQALLAHKFKEEIAAENALAALKIDPTRADAYSVLAAAHAAQGDWPELDATLAEADSNVPDDLTPHFRAAEALIAAGKNPAAAEANLRKYLQQEPEGNEPLSPMRAAN